VAEDLGSICFEACPEALMIVRDGLVVRVNEEMCRLLGIRAGAEAEGRRIEEIIPMDLDNRVGLHSALSRILPGDVRAYEWELSLPGAVYIPVIIRATGLGGGGLLLSLRDFTEGQQRNRAILDHEEQRRALLESTASPVFCVDRECRILWCSGSFASIAGERPGSLAGRQCHRMLVELDSPCPGCPAIQAMRTRSVLSNAPCAAGRAFRVSASSFRGYDGSPAGAVLTILTGPQGPEPRPLPESADGAATGGPAEVGPGIPPPAGSPPGAPEAGGAAPRDLDVTGWLNSSLDRLESLLGSPLEIMAPEGSARARVSPEDLLEAFNNLAGADFGTCLPESGGVVVRVDRAELAAGLHGMAAGRYLSVSLGTKLVLGSAECSSLPGGRQNRLSSFPMNAASRSGGSPGAVFVSRADGDHRFYQIMIPVSDQGR